MTVTEGLVSPKQRIVDSALQLLRDGGLDAVSTRAVSAAAGVQAPTIYRHFGDMRGLLDEVAAQGFRDYLVSKGERRQAADPVDDLRDGWDLHHSFGLANPALYGLMFGPRQGEPPPALEESYAVLRSLVQRAAEAGRLSLGVDAAARMIHAASVGAVMTLIVLPPDRRDDGLSVAMREATLAAVTTGRRAARPSSPAVAPRAVALKAALPPEPDELTAAERALLDEWLDRLSGPRQTRR